MILDLLCEFFLGKKHCNHEHLAVDCDFGYCPDCGEMVENKWFITRCACCGIKEKATIINGKIVPIQKYCHNCGSQDYVVERLEKIDFININYAVLKRESVKEPFNMGRITQCWVDVTRKIDDTPKLLPLFQ